MSTMRVQITTDLREMVGVLNRRMAGWPATPTWETPRAAVAEAVGILEDAVVEMQPKQKTGARA